MKNCLCFFILYAFGFVLVAQNTQKWQTIANPQKNADVLVKNRKAEWGLSSKDAFVRPNEVPKADKLGFKHYRYQQTYQNVPIEGAEWLVHEKNGIARKVNGNLVSGLNISTIPTLSEEQALQYALNVVNAEIWGWEDDFLEQMLRVDLKDEEATYYPTGKLVITSPDLTKGNASAESYRLTYCFDIFAAHPMTRQEIYIDAHSGETVTSFSLIFNADVAATGNAHYSCDNPVNITIDDTNGFYILSQDSRQIHVRTAENTTSTPDYDIVSNDAFFNEDSNAVAVYYATEKFYDYLLNVHGRNSIDDNGYKLKAWVHFGENLNNAQWASNSAMFGDGDNITYGPLTSIDIVAHEFAHGLVANTAKLKHSYEAGALNEGFCDIFGTLVEFYAEPACADWLIGEDAVMENGKIASRNMGNPKDASVLNQQPNTYEGQYWQTSSYDHGGVHTNNGVLNYWFYLIVHGGSGTNDNALAYNVAPLDSNPIIAREKAEDIVFRALTVYLTANAQYSDAREASIEAAIDLYNDVNSNEVQTLLNAWCAVGVGGCEMNNDNITIVSPNGGEMWEYGNEQEIIWTSSNSITQVDISYSINGGVSWGWIAENTNNDENFLWSVPNVATTQAMIRITDSNSTPNDISDMVFTINTCDVISSFNSSSFNSSSLNTCEAQVINFENTSVTSGTDNMLYVWSVNGIIKSVSKDFNEFFAEAGTYIIKLVSNNNGCTDEYTEVITIHPTPIADFTHAITDFSINCHVINTNATTHTWTIDNINVGSFPSLEYTFAAEGVYNVCLTASNECGSNEVCKYVNINEQPICSNGDESWSVYSTSNSSLPNNNISSLLESSNGEIFIGTGNGIAKLNELNDWTIFDNFSPLFNDNISSLLENSNGEIFVGTNTNLQNNNGGLAKFDGINISSSTIYNVSNSDLPSNNIQTLLESSNGEIFVGTAEGGLAKFDGISNTTWTIFNASNSDLPSNNIQTLLESSNGEIFVGTAEGGLAKFDGISNTAWTIFNASNSDLPNNNIQTLLESSNGEIFVGTAEGGLAKFDGISNTGWTVANMDNSALPSNNITSLLESSRGEIFIGTWGGGLLKFDDANGANGKIYNTQNSFLATNNIKVLLETSENEIFVGTDSGIFVLNLGILNASFSTSSTDFICTGIQKTFINTSVNATTYEWLINGSLVSTTAGNLSHTFSQVGAYNIHLKATNSENCKNSYTQNIIVYHQATDLFLSTNTAQCDIDSLELIANLRDMQSYEWQHNGVILGTTENLIVTQTGTYSLTVIDRCGNTYSDDIEAIVDTCVWPGDFNYDKIVNNYDLLSLGFGFGESGSERPNSSFNWEGQPAHVWEESQESGVNYKHIDADGNGIIDAKDLQAIDVNYRKTHNSYVVPPNDTDSQFTVSTQRSANNSSNIDLQTGSSYITIDIILEENDLQDLQSYGLAFDLDYTLPFNVISVSDVSVNFESSFLGTVNELLTISKHFPDENLIEIGVTRYDGSNVIGQGKIGEVVFEVVLEDEGFSLESASLDLRVGSVQLALSNNTFIAVSGSTDSFGFAASCAVPINLTETNLSCTDVTVQWDAFSDADAYRLQGRRVGSPIKVFPDMTNNFLNLTGNLQANTTYEWRVKAICGNDTSDYSAIKSFTTPTCKNNTYDSTKDPFFVNESENFLNEISLYPNPVKNHLYVQFACFEDKNTSIKMINIFGKTVLIQDIETQKGENNIMLNIKDLQSGYYFLQIENNIQKFMVL